MTLRNFSLTVFALVVALVGGCTGGSDENPVTPEKVKMMNDQRSSGPSRAAAPGTGPGVDQGPGSKH